MIERLTGLKGTLDAKEGVFRVSAPRAEPAVEVAGVRLVPRLGITSWAAFEAAGDHAMVMGDLVLLEGQVNPLISLALDNGLEVTALHNHFLWDSPRLMFMHIAGHGPLESLASAVGRVFAAVAAAPSADGFPRAAIDPARTDLDQAKIEAVIGVRGELKDGVFRVSLAKAVRMAGFEMGGAMGVNTWAAFAGSDSQAVVDGDFAVFEPELQPVLRALRRADIQVVAIHHHMIGETPRVIFVHYWGIGPAPQLARGLKAALEAQASVVPPPEAGQP